jgi:hypothetical protein
MQPVSVIVRLYQEHAGDRFVSRNTQERGPSVRLERLYAASRVCLHRVTVWAGSGSDSSGVDAYGMCGISLIEAQISRILHAL